MDDNKPDSYITLEERLAFSWLWRGYLRRFMPSIILVFVLVLAHSAALVGFLALIRGSFADLFDPNNGEFIFVNEVLRSHEDGRQIDSNGDGIYELEIEVKTSQQSVGNWMTIFISVLDSDPKNYDEQEREINLSNFVLSVGYQYLKISKYLKIKHVDICKIMSGTISARFVLSHF